MVAERIRRARKWNEHTIFEGGPENQRRGTAYAQPQLIDVMGSAGATWFRHRADFEDRRATSHDCGWCASEQDHGQVKRAGGDLGRFPNRVRGLRGRVAEGSPSV